MIFPFFLSAAILVFSLAGFAGRNVFSLFILQILVGLNYAAAFPRLWNPDSCTRRALAASSGAVVFTALFICWSALQIWTPAFLKPFGVGSVDTGRSFDFLCQSVIYILFFFAQLSWCGHRSWMRRLEVIMLLAAVSVGVLGIFQRAPGEEGYLWAAYFVKGSDPFGPFFNNDDFGAWITVLFPWMLAGLDYRHTLSLRKIEEIESQHNVKASCEQVFFSHLKTGVFLYAAAVLFLPAACFVARARSALAVLLILTLIYALVRMADPAKRGRVLFLICAILGSVVLYGSVLIFHEYSFANLKAGIIQRIDFARQNWSLAMMYAPFGSGLGTYKQIAAQGITYFRDGTLPEYGYHEGIELISDSGWPGFFLASAATILFFVQCVQGWARHVSEWRRLMSLQAAISLMGVLFLSQISFHLKTPAIAFLVVFQLAIACSLHKRLKSKEEEKNTRKRFLFRHMFLIFMAMLACFCVWNAGTRLYTEIQIKSAPSVMVLQQAVRRHPEQAMYRQRLAAELEKMFNEGYVGDEALDQAVEEMREALRLSPSYGYYAFYLAVLLEKQGKDNEALQMYDRSISFAPHEFRHYFQMLKLLMKRCLQSELPADKIKFSLQARAINKKMRSLDFAPSEARIREGMGPRGYDLLKQFESVWQR